MYNRIITLTLLLFGKRVNRDNDIVLTKGVQIPYKVQHVYSAILDEYAIFFLN